MPNEYAPESAGAGQASEVTVGERQQAEALAPVSVRAVVIGLLLVPLNAYWLINMELVRGIQYPTSVSLFFNVIFTLIVVMTLNGLVTRIVPRWALSRRELVVIYVLVSLGSATSGIDWSGLVPVIGYPYRYATPENNWAELVLPTLPQHLIVSDERALAALWGGSSSLYLPENYTHWVGPIIRWQIFLALMCLTFLCLASVFRKRWIESERLTYPIAQIPMAMMLVPERLYRAKWFWIAFGLVCLFDLMNGLHIIKPAIPALQLTTANPSLHIHPQLIDRPWNALGFLSVSCYPFVVGLSLLIPTELLFSCWVFYLFFKAQFVATSYFGALEGGGGLPFMREQSFGAYMGLVIFSLVMSRAHIRRAVAAAIAGAKGSPEGDPIRYRITVLLGVLGFVGMVAFGVWAGMSVWYAVAFFVIYLLISLSLTRIRAEMGIPSHELHYVGPGQILPRLLGPQVVGSGNMIVSYVFYWFNYGHRCHPMPHIAEAHSLAGRARLHPRSMAAPMLAAMVLGGVTASWVALHIYHHDGAAAKWAPYLQSVWIASAPMTEIVTKLQTPGGLDFKVIGAAALGFLFTIGAMTANSRFGFWPLHPIGYAVSSAWAMEHMWCSMLIAWAIKSLITRYGGHMAFRRVVPIAMGLVIGDFLCGGLWSLYGLRAGIRAYSSWP